MPIGIGGPVPSLELLYVASELHHRFPEKYNIKIIDMGLEGNSLENIQNEIELNQPMALCLHALAWEAGLVHKIAAIAKQKYANGIVIVFGQLATVAHQHICEDHNIDYVILGEPEWAMPALMEALSAQTDTSHIPGLVYKNSTGDIVRQDPVYPDDIDSLMISSFAWDLIDIHTYAQYSNWNGAIKEKFYVPILTSRGCPFNCTYCYENYDKRFRARSPESVVSEIRFLKEKFQVQEIHVFDSVFNYDLERAKAICRLIIDSGLSISLAFPHGIRVDRMSDELLSLLKQAGTYKVVYGIETAVPRLQKVIRKNLDLSQARDIISKTAQTGIITGGYFMLGFPSETLEEMEQTIDFAVKSDLDVAAFFKATNYDFIKDIYKTELSHVLSQEQGASHFQDVSYFSKKGSQSGIPVSVLNQMISKAQRRFYLNARRFWRGLKKYPNKFVYLNNFLNALGLILQAQLINSLGTEEPVNPAKSRSEKQEHV